MSCHGCRGIAGAAACRYHPVSGRLSGLSGIAFSHSRREPPGRGMWCVFVRCVDNLQVRTLEKVAVALLRPQSCT
ncbi:hypothetical protein NDU88_003519 [Pleurodeles waltl]|uniref:Uncharacterized protein n=1 Tax=Pleurodeles waltl TaxID=8319 RepID=A0AAV7RGU3_PLEWA|nr:hypothetical protein NDU88_003519 [Pleurodeles waltl]